MLGYSLAQDSSFQLGSRGSNSQSTPLSLLDMLKAYAVGFYKVALALQQLRFHAQLGSKRALNEGDKAEFEAFPLL